MSLIETWTLEDFKTWIIHEEEDWLAINKPAGVSTAPSEHHAMDLSRWIKTIYPEGALAHRLDRVASGVLIITKNKKAQRDWFHVFENNGARKSYMAMVFGETREKGVIDIKIDPKVSHGKVKVNRGKMAITKYRLLAYDADRDVSLVLGEPVTGRTHQIRAHFWAINHAVVGDSVYRSRTTKPAWARPLARPWLHAFRLVTEFGGKQLKLIAPLPADLRSYLSEVQQRGIDIVSDSW